MEWMNDTCLQLIDEYEKHPILWNSLHPQYYNRTEKLEAWNIIAESFGISTDEVRRKMESLLGSYRGIKSRVRKRSEALGVFRESKWFAFNRLDQFMAKMKPDTTSTFEVSRNKKNRHKPYTMVWSSQLCLRLIDEYEKREELWNPSHPFYYRQNNKIDAWKSISKALGFSIYEVRRKMETLHGSFRRERAKLRRKKGWYL
ncbi:hypothetical protein MML48_2g00000433 [Holotrichia oblita]|uniref:Uncharacterized protein n=1 Tax=Holotrichia oblita TaxID=644536 RepID=A0ACB9TQ29_HOLOL|nr:hypothetical protein MML48_2g00000433 [Holotrichia oblita]